ncbi:MAG: hypothetical protein AVDCRST_MAG01-01-2048, partial [uncultured Rubrobacteraceae bacterium]
DPERARRACVVPEDEPRGPLLAHAPALRARQPLWRPQARHERAHPHRGGRRL